MNRERLLVWLLWAAGAVEVLAFFAVVMPRSWMEASHAWLGMGEMRPTPLLMLMIRQASYSYGMHGVGLWVLASDVRRFRPLVILNGVAFLLAAPVFYFIDVSSGIPWWWTVTDVVGCGLLGALLLWLAPAGAASPPEPAQSRSRGRGRDSTAGAVESRPLPRLRLRRVLWPKPSPPASSAWASVWVGGRRRRRG